MGSKIDRKLVVQNLAFCPAAKHRHYVFPMLITVVFVPFAYTGYCFCYVIYRILIPRLAPVMYTKMAINLKAVGMPSQYKVYIEWISRGMASNFFI